ncbi:sensor histidine kinase [Plantactinospora soyae]|uniref:histidine kinase n=1 Tax=Plantactinospora soyae TaxID=1544732 RepID=A0A927M0B6_9ACTN|nr:histidine kinase [Plantactinospora soyae]MBE1484422.1 signal transduction histidine kinase [Plantactinospora soyae]
MGWAPDIRWFRRWAGDVMPARRPAVSDGTLRHRRTLRDWIVDAVLFGLAVLFWAWTWQSAPLHYVDAIPDWMHTIDPWVSGLGCLALWWRRRYPIGIGIAMVLVMALAATGLAAVLIVVLTVAVHRNWQPATLVTALHLLPSLLFGYENPPSGVTRWAYITLICLMYLTPLGWGIAVRARRQLIANLHRDAERERREHRHRLSGARRAERERIAREMHDVLAHRISLITVHAGALAYRTKQADAGVGAPLDAGEVGGAIEVIRDNARQALVELGDVLAVLRPADTAADADPDDADGDPREPDADPDDAVGSRRQAGGSASGTAADRAAPQPRLADIARLVREAQEAGQRVTFEMVCAPGAADSLRPAVQRTVYRTVQEGLTNARKHAGQAAEVAVRVEATPATGIVATVSNPLPQERRTVEEMPGAGAGLTGLAERLTIDGGTIEHGVIGGTFRLTTRLPWPA